MTRIGRRDACIRESVPSAYVHAEPYAQSESRITGLWGSAGNPTPPVGGKNREARVWGARGRGREREREEGQGDGGRRTGDRQVWWKSGIRGSCFDRRASSSLRCINGAVIGYLWSLIVEAPPSSWPAPSGNLDGTPGKMDLWRSSMFDQRRSAIFFSPLASLLLSKASPRPCSSASIVISCLLTPLTGYRLRLPIELVR